MFVKKTVNDLRAIDEQQRAEAARITEKILDLQAERSDVVIEADSARTIADKLERLISA